MIEVPNNLIGAIGLLNGATNSSAANLRWMIGKSPEKEQYAGFLGDPDKVESDKFIVVKDHIDDLVAALVKAAQETYDL